MRIVSQDKMIDTSYNGTVIYIYYRKNDTQIYVSNIGNDEGFPIGTYNNGEDAVYVMSLIRTAFAHENQYFYMPEAEDVSAIRTKMDGGEQK